MADKILNIQEIMGRADFGDLLKDGLNPVLIEGTEMETSEWKEIYQSMQMTKYSMTFYTLGGLAVGRIVEGQEIPFVNLGSGKTQVYAEEYGVRAGYTHQMIRDGEIDVMRYTTQELGKAHARKQNEVAFNALTSVAGCTCNYKTINDTNGLGLIDAIRFALAKALLICDSDHIPRPVAYDTIVINPMTAYDLIPSRYGGDEDLPTGLVFDPATGKLTGILGLRVVVTPWIANGTVILCKAKDGILYLEREGLSLDRTERFETACEEVRIMSAWTFAILKAHNVCKLTADNSLTTLAFTTPASDWMLNLN